ncbi:hypothetical protein HK102_006956 [Quaeritorhiza haematococci]|nr:hypothetical protein HK102_006956 [Quaeritorhiza haematococci]
MDPQTPIIAVFGMTGAGKSHFISSVLVEGGSGANCKTPIVGHTLQSCTNQIEPFEATINGQQVVLVDTPGFDDTDRPDEEIVHALVEWFAKSYWHGGKITGVVFLHSLAIPRMSGTVFHYLRVFRALVGDDCLNRVVFVTNRWDMVDNATGIHREEDLKSNYWSLAMSRGATVTRYTTPKSALEIVGSVVSQSQGIPVHGLAVQREVVEGGLSAEQTSALVETKRAERQRLEEMEREAKAKIQAEKERFEQEMWERERQQQEALRREQQRRQAEETARRLAALEWERNLPYYRKTNQYAIKVVHPVRAFMQVQFDMIPMIPNKANANSNHATAASPTTDPVDPQIPPVNLPV